MFFVAARLSLDWAVLSKSEVILLAGDAVDRDTCMQFGCGERSVVDASVPLLVQVCSPLQPADCEKTASVRPATVSFLFDFAPPPMTPEPRIPPLNRAFSRHSRDEN